MNKELCIYAYLYVFAISQVASGDFSLLTWEYWAFVAPVSLMFGVKVGLAYCDRMESRK